ncbi:hypothetical protein WG66_009624 [Moniliophthora roreri]|nr:hypothetical protein WG66_009624 [Moniliophthora roreri]
MAHKDLQEYESTDIGWLAAISEVAPDPAAVIYLSLTIFAFALYRCLRRIYPCITLSELKIAQEKLEDAFNEAVEKGYLYGHDLDDITRTKLCLKRYASEIRLLSASSIWQVYLGLHIELAPDIVRWYNAAASLQRDIVVIVEHDTQQQCDAEISRRDIAASRVLPPPPPVTPIIPFPSTSHHYREAQHRHRHRSQNGSC